MEKPSGPLRVIRSFVLRQGRLTPGQRAALTTLAPAYMLDPSQPLGDGRVAFGTVAPLVFEVGFGMGDSLLACAAAAPDTHFVGVEVHAPGVGRLLHQVAEHALKNVRVYQADAVGVLTTAVLPDSLDKVLLYFPDPWPKKRHHKRRIVQTPFATLVASRLKAGGLFHLATDIEDYALHMQAVLENHPDFENVYGPNGFAPNDGRPQTKFERRGLNLGHGVWDLMYRRR